MNGKFELQPLPKDYRSLFRLAEAQGWEHTRTGKDHHKFVSPDGSIVVTSGTPSDKRALDNFRAQMKRAGLRPYMPLKEDKKLSEPKLVVSKVEGDSTNPVPPVGVKPKRKQISGRGELSSVMIAMLTTMDKPDGLSADDILPAVQAKLPHITKHNLGVALANHASRKAITRVGFGRYRALQSVVPPPAEDDDAKVLDEAITVLAKLEGVIRRMQDKLKRIEEAKAAFAAIK